MNWTLPEKPPLRRPLAQQIAEVRREIALRERVYPGFVIRKKMRQSEADEHLARMVAVLATLEWLQINIETERSNQWLIT